MSGITEALAWLDAHLDHESGSVGVAAGQIAGLSLAPAQELMELLGDPQSAYPVIHVTGTNGKGSTAAMISELLVASGLSVGLYTSPHLERLNERIRRDREPVSDEDLAEVLGGIAMVEGLCRVRPTWFEVVTAAALRWFADVAVDVAVVEVGLLGRFDATNVVEADVAVVTGIGGDHTDFSPGWEVKVAGEKAGIITPGRPVVLGSVPEDLVALFDAEGASPVLRMGTDFGVSSRAPAVGGQVLELFGPYGTHHEVMVSMYGAHQAENAAVAVCAVESFFGRPLDEDVLASLAELGVRGRLELLARHPLVLLDAAHNPDALAAMAGTVAEELSVPGSRIVVFGMLAGRDPGRALDALGRLGPDLVICTSTGGERGHPAVELASIAGRMGLASEAVADPAAAVTTALQVAAEEDLVLVCGSFRLLEVARRIVETDA